MDELCLRPTGLNLDPRVVLFVPGNHDVDRSAISPAASAIEDALAKARVQADIARYYQNQESLRLLLCRQSAYTRFCNSFTSSNDFAQVCWTRTFNFKGKRIRFDGFNSSWLCRGSDDRRRLLVGQPQISESIATREAGEVADISIALLHHPLADLMEFDEQNFESHLRQHCDLLLRGHLHHSDVVSRNTADGAYVEIAAGALHETHEAHNSFRIIDLADDLTNLSVRPFVWHNGRWILDRNTFSATNDGIGKFAIGLRATVRAGQIPAAPVPQQGSQREYLTIAGLDRGVVDASDNSAALDVLHGASSISNIRRSQRPCNPAGRDCRGDAIFGR